MTYLYRPNNRFKAMHPKGERFMRVLVSFVFLFNKEHNEFIYTTLADCNFSVNRRRLLETFNKSFI